MVFGVDRYAYGAISGDGLRLGLELPLSSHPRNGASGLRRFEQVDRPRMSQKRIGFACFSSPGHLNPSLSLARRLADRGFEVIFFSLADGVDPIQRSGFECRVYGAQSMPLEAILEGYREVGRLTGMAAVRHTIHGILRRAEAGLREYPDLLEDAQLGGLIVDQILPDAAAVARAIGLPFVTVCNALPMNLDSGVPPVFSRGLPGPGFWPAIRNRFLNGLASHLARPMLQAINRFQADRGLSAYADIADVESRLAQVTQIPREFDFAGRSVPDTFHYTGPFHETRSRLPVDFPWENLDPSRPLVYASMGTLQNQIRSIFGVMAAACQPLNVQLVIALGNGGDPAGLGDLPGDPVVVRHSPQLELLDRAALCVTHAGLNTTLESLARGVPMVAIPITNDQPGVAARIAAGKLGMMLPLHRLNETNLRDRINRTLGDDVIADRVRCMRQRIAGRDGLATAADIIDRAIATRCPVVHTSPVGPAAGSLDG